MVKADCSKFKGRGQVSKFQGFKVKSTGKGKVKGKGHTGKSEGF
jgi:hypothetical protein